VPVTDLSIRQRAKRFLARLGERGGHLVTSKFYRPDESWTQSKAWWVQIPWPAVRAGKTIHVVLEAAPGSPALRYLRVPAQYFIEHESELATLAPDKINLFLAATPDEEFQDQRGSGRVSFARFEQPSHPTRA
jgi:hypothetical protein